MAAWTRKRLEEKEEKEKEKAKESAAALSASINVHAKGHDIFDSGEKLPYTSPITPNTAFNIRNRMLSKLGAKVSSLHGTHNGLCRLIPALEWVGMDCYIILGWVSMDCFIFLGWVGMDYHPGVGGYGLLYLPGVCVSVYGLLVIFLGELSQFFT